jgi:hypothetical protein
MQTKYEAPELMLLGPANHVVMGSGCCDNDNLQQTAPDFEFEPDWPLT